MVEWSTHFLFQALIHVMSGLSRLGLLQHYRQFTVSCWVLQEVSGFWTCWDERPRCPVLPGCQLGSSGCHPLQMQRFGPEHLVQHAPSHGVCSRHCWWQETHQPFGTEVSDSEALRPQHRFKSYQASQRSQECWVHYQLRSSEQQTAGNNLWCVRGPDCTWIQGWPTCTCSSRAQRLGQSGAV